MAEMIDRETLKKAIDTWDRFYYVPLQGVKRGCNDDYTALVRIDDILHCIDNMPAADVQPIRHGRWIETHISLCKWIPEDEKEEGHSFYMAELKCSCCKRYNTVTFTLTLNKPDFCQLCGARMDLKDGETK